VISISSGALVYLTTRDVLGEASGVLVVAVSAIACYLILSEPGREFETVSLWQAREAPLLAASAAVSLEATGSRAKTILLLRSEEEELAKVLEETKRMVLLGHAPSVVVSNNCSRIASEAASRALLSISTSDPGGIEDEGREVDSVYAASSLGEETKVPIFIAVCFFTPVMLILFAVMTHRTMPADLAELLALQFVILNLALAFSSLDRRRLSI